MKTTTIFEIAKSLNISPSTVSRALHDHPNIASQTKAKVLAMAEKLNYEPNPFAVSLRSDNSREIAIIAPSLSGFYYDSFISAVEQECRKLGYSLIILLSGDDPQVEIQNLKTCKQRRVAGIMLCVTSKTSEVDFFKKLNIPLIFFDKVPTLEGANFVISDDHQAASLAAKALLEKGKLNVLSIFGDLNFSITRKRLEGFHAVFKNSNTNIIVAHAANSLEAEETVLATFKREKPDALFCMSDEILIGAMKAIQMLGLSIPKQVSVIAISNGFFPRLYYPEITYVETSGYKLGQLAVAGFLAQLDRTDPHQQELILTPKVIAGDSL